MNSRIFFPYLIFIFILNLACQGQVKMEQKKSTAVDPNIIKFPIGIQNKPADPYFIEIKDTSRIQGPQVITRNILQDQKGNIWFASYQGLIRFNGETYSNLTNELGLLRYRFFSLLEDKNNTLWAGTVGNGVYHYDGEIFRNFTTIDGLSDDKIECMLQDNMGKIWFGTGNGLSSFDGKTFANFKVSPTSLDNDIHSIVQDKEGKMWVGTSGSLFIFDGEKFALVENKDGKTYKNVRIIMRDNIGNIWFGGNDGLNVYDGKRIINFMTNFIGNLLQDSKGTIWISASQQNNTGKMVLHKYTHLPNPSLGDLSEIKQIRIGEGLIFGFCEDKDGNLWYGTTEGSSKILISE